MYLALPLQDPPKFTQIGNFCLKPSGNPVDDLDLFRLGQNTLELPPELDKGETGIFQSDPAKTLVSIS
jgi:hypothetical protein